MGPKTKSAHRLRWHYGDRVTMGQFSNSFPKHFSYLCEYAFRCDLSCSFCEYPFVFHCLHCSPSCFDPDSLLLAHLWLGLSWIYCISANKRFSSPKTSSRKPYTSSKQQERQKHSVETTIKFSVRGGDWGGIQGHLGGGKGGAGGGGWWKRLEGRRGERGGGAWGVGGEVWEGPGGGSVGGKKQG